MSISHRIHNMNDDARFPSNAVDMYNRCGFAILQLFDESQVRLLEKFAKDWLYRLLAEWTAGKEDLLPLETYHIWSKSLPIDHGNIFRNMNRHTTPGLELENALINDRLRSFLSRIGVKDYKMWEEDIGWLCFRFIRPGAGDGYPMSRKDWGEAKDVVSMWVPIIGYSPRETLALVPGSHLKEYEKYLPTNDKFCKSEYRLAPIYTDLEVYRPKLERGQAIIYHPKTLHTEDVVASDVTRLNLEFRFNPMKPLSISSGHKTSGT